MYVSNCRCDDETIEIGIRAAALNHPKHRVMSSEGNFVQPSIPDVRGFTEFFTCLIYRILYLFVHKEFFVKNNHQLGVHPTHAQ